MPAEERATSEHTVVVPLVKVTVPVSAGPLVSAAWTATDAVYVSGCPTTGEAVAATTEVVVEAGLTIIAAWAEDPTVPASPE